MKDIFEKKSAGKRIIRIIVIVLITVLVLVLAYAAYLFLSYKRIGNSELGIVDGNADMIKPGQDYTAVTWNIGFGAYTADYGFFMDGGTESWAVSKEGLDRNLNQIAAFLKDEQADIYMIEEVDTDATRSYHTDERVPITAVMKDYSYCYNPNFDSPFLMYPILQPHGKSKAGMMTFSAFRMTDAERVELPVEDGLMKLLDLDRCYTKVHVPVEDGGELVLYTVHLSAYTSDGTISARQLRMLLNDMQSEYEKGSYCIAGGDFNKDLLGDSSAIFGKADKEYTWAQPIPADMFDGCDLHIVSSLNAENPVPSCRNADGPYHSGQFVVTADGFIVSDNVEVKECSVLDTGFAYSDHNPVRMVFSLTDAALSE